MVNEPEDNNTKHVEQKVPDMKRWWQNTTVHVALILAVGSVIYSRIISAPFVYDDFGCIVLNPAICNFSFVTDMTPFKSLLNEDIYKNMVLRPVAYWTFAVNYYLHGFNVVGYHLFNVFVHFINALLVYLITRYTLDTRTPVMDKSGEPSLSITRLVPLFAALLFVGHPLQIQSVTYITQRFTSLAALFYLLSLALYIVSERSQTRLRRSLFYAGSFIVACIAMKTKEIAFTLPMIILVYEFTFFSGSLKLRIIKLAPFMLTMSIIPVTVMKLNTVFLHATDSSVGQSMNLVNYTGISKWDYLITQFRVIVTYIRLLIMPINQRLVYDNNLYTSILQPSVVLSFSLIVAILGTGVYLLHSSKTAEEPYRTRLRLIAFGALWFFIVLSVESSVIPLDDYLVEQRVYLPSVGLIWVFVTVMALIFDNRRRVRVSMFTVVLGLVVVTLSTFASVRNSLWRYPILLWLDTAQKCQRDIRPYLNLGAHYFDKRMFQKALDALSTAVRLEPDNIQASLNITSIYLAINRFDEAETEYLRALKIHPADGQLYNSLVRLYMLQKKHSKALPLLQQTVRLNPTLPEARVKLAELYELMGHREQAISQYMSILQLLPGDTDTIDKLKKLAER